MAKKTNAAKVPPETFDINPIPVVAAPPTWRMIRNAAAKAVDALGGQEGIAGKFGWDTYYTLTYLKCLNVDGPQGDTVPHMTTHRRKRK